VTVPAPVRVTCWVIADLAIATLGPKLIQDQIYVSPQSTRIASILNAQIGGAVVAFLLGSTAYFLKRRESAKWIWIAGVSLAGYGIASFWFGSELLRAVGAGRSVFWEISGRGCEANESNCEWWMIYSLLPSRIISYAGGAFVMSFCLRYLPGWVRNFRGETIAGVQEDSE
jgi:hypothetical protein